MVSLGNPKAWIPYMNSKDCSQGFCSLYCPQWCYVIFPPPPPSPLDEFPNDSSSGPNFSPLVIAIIGILASALLLVSYYTIISKYCGNNRNSTERRSRRENLDHLDQLEVENEDNQNPSLHEPWHAATAGLDETLIKSITVCKYRKGDGLIEGTDCSVCLSEFEEGESVRLLPKCSHAFHVPCIDTWLRSHSNCPLCRANIFFISASAPLIPHQPSSFTPPLSTAEISPQGTNNHNQSAEDRQEEANENAAVAEEAEMISEEEGTQHNNGGQKGTPLRVLSDLGNFEQRNTIVEVRDGAACHQHIWRSISMDHHSCQRSHIVVSDIMTMNHNQDEAFRAEEEDFSSSGGGGGGARDHVGSSKNAAEEFISKFCSRHKRRVLNCVLSPVRMKRSFSGERFLLARQGRIRESDITSPV